MDFYYFSKILYKKMDFMNGSKLRFDVELSNPLYGWW